MPEENWRESLSDDLKGNESLSTFEDVNALATSFIETKALVGSGLRFPSEDSSDDDRKAFIDKVMEKAPTLMLKPDFDNEEQSTEFFRTLGLPNDSAGYETPKFEELAFDEKREGFLRELAHKTNLTKSQFNALTAGMLEFDHGILSAGESQTSEAMAALKQEWGMTWKERRGLANKVRETFLDFIPEAQMDAQTIKALHAIGTQLGSGEGTELGDLRNEGGGTGKMTPAEALGKIEDIMNNAEHAYWISAHPGHQAALDAMVELRKQADPAAGTILPRAGFGS